MDKYGDAYEFLAYVREVVKKYQGDYGKLGAAIGCLHLGFCFGWRSIWLHYSKRTIREYEAILGVSFRVSFPEYGEFAFKHDALRAWGGESNYWKFVSGDLPLKGRCSLSRITVKELPFFLRPQA